MATRIFSRLFNALDTTRKVVVNAVFLIILVLLVAMVFGGQRFARVEQGIAVVFDPSGTLVEEFDASPMDRALARALDTDIPQVRLRDLKAALKLAAEDKRVAAIVLDLGGLAPSSLSKVTELMEPVALARANGKRVFAYADIYGQSQYLLAAGADEIVVHPMGAVVIEGFATYRTYWKEALDKLSIDYHVFKAGDYKSYGEPYERRDMSPQVREETAAWLNALWAQYRTQVEGARALEQGTIAAYVGGMTQGLRAANGNFAQYAAEAGLVDSRLDYAGFVERVAEVVGADDDTGFRGIGWEAYLATNRHERSTMLSKRDRIALIVARGTIVDGDPGLHVVGASRLVGLISEARDDDRVKALVLRVDSPGGSPLASEEIRLELERFRASGKPVVISMSSVAASGGYWISLASDRIFASPATITGSIGVVGTFPTIPRALDRLGINVDGVSTTPLAGAIRMDRPLSDEMRELIQVTVDGIYSEFIERVAAARGMDLMAVDRIGGGRVYSGTDAKEIGLVDELGDLDDALEAAAGLAGLEEYAVSVFDRAPSMRERIILSLLDTRMVEPLVRGIARADRRPLSRVVGWLDAELSEWALMGDRRHVYMHCLCKAP